MKKFKNLTFYIIILLGFSAIIFFIIRQGNALQAGKFSNYVPQALASNWEQFKETYIHNLTNPLAILLLQILTIIVVARFLGFICRKIRQPSVIGEIAAGILLGPSFVGMFFPEFSSFLFPVNSLGNLQFLSQIGLILFLFVVGMELDVASLRNKAKEAVVVSHASIIFPFTLGTALSYFMYREFAPDNIPFLAFALFMGIAMSITAFPVLARIVQERNLSKTKLGTIVITCAAADDITAWCLLAGVIAIVKAGSIISALFTIIMAVAYVIVMLKVIQPFLHRLGEKYSTKESISKPVVAIFFLTLLGSSYMTEVIGIHSLFGAFMAGVIMPSRVNFRNIFIEKIEDVALVLLLPLFFVFTGLRTQIGLLNEPHLWWACLAIIAVAVVGKFAGSALAARYVGQNWKDSLSIGALMNTRGLMELVVLNIGYDLGVLSPSIFAMMVIMALATTFMTGPALDIINRIFPEKSKPQDQRSMRRFSILITFRVAQKGVSLLKLAACFVSNSLQNSRITVMHLTPSTELNTYNQEEYERESFEPVKREANLRKIPITTLFKASANIEQDITQTANATATNLLLIGVGSSVYEGSILGKILGLTSRFINPERLFDTLTGKEKLFDSGAFDETVKNIMRNATVPVGIFLDKGFTDLKNVYVLIDNEGDMFIFDYVQKLHQNGIQISLLPESVIKTQPLFNSRIKQLSSFDPSSISLINELPVQDNSSGLVIVSADSWKQAVEENKSWLSSTPSVLIIKKGS